MHNKANPRISYGSRLDVILRWTSQRARDWAESLVLLAESDDGVKAVVAVGSAIRKVSHSADVDFVIIHDEGKPPYPPSPPIDIDVRAYSTGGLDAKVQEGNDLLGWAIAFGEIVFERDEYWTLLRARWHNRLPLPSATEAQQRGARAEHFAKELLLTGDQDAAEEQRLAALTHFARAKLIQVGVYPASRPELPAQLQSISENDLADQLDAALQKRAPVSASSDHIFDRRIFDSHVRLAGLASDNYQRFDELWRAVNHYYQSLFRQDDPDDLTDYILFQRASRLIVPYAGSVFEACLKTNLRSLEPIFDERIWRRRAQKRTRQHEILKRLLWSWRRGRRPKPAEVAKVLELIYVVRCNLHHGFKTPEGSRDRDVLAAVTPPLREIVAAIERSLKAAQGAA